jgi:diaminohydroxyphosphoribosylaminopyrimidine deaminase/5-amino-6-(5-phosphoribosylamino)uracil reductase
LRVRIDEIRTWGARAPGRIGMVAATGHVIGLSSPAAASTDVPAASPASDVLGAMRHALDLARSGLGSTGANPCVGAVVLDPAGHVVGAGRTEPHRPGTAGRHAEIVALAAAGERAAGGTIVSTLEPCNGIGRTGRCVDAIVEAKVARCAYGAGDPIPSFAGGSAALAAAGIDVIGGVLLAQAREVHTPWLVAVGRSRPWVTLKLAVTLDGRAAAADGSSQWITSAEARADAHLLRGRVDAIVAGSGTVLADDPQLTVRGTAESRTPLRVVLDGRARVPSSARVFDPSAPSLRYGGRDLAELLSALFTDHAVRHVLVEGGPVVAGAFLAAGFVDEVVAYVAPAILGAGPQALVTDAFPSIADARRLEIHEVVRVGSDVRIDARFAESADGVS